MIAAFYEKNGAARDVLRVDEIPTPTPGPGEVRVRLHAAGLNPADGYVRAGMLGPMAFPRIVPGLDGAGIVESTGSASRFRPGDRVWVYLAQWQRPFGAAAEYCVLPEANVVPLPDSISFVDGATWGTSGITAHVALSTDGPIEGKTVLVSGGGGGTGLFAIQLAKSYGARVVTTVSSPTKADIARQAGADLVVNYRTPTVADEIIAFTEGRGVDHIVELALATNFELDAQVLATHGRIAAYGSAGSFTPTLPLLPLMFKHARVNLVGGFIPTAADVQAVSKAGAAHVLRPVIWQQFPLARIADAHEALDSNAVIGKAVLLIP